jgi:hypothetical protein
MKDPSQPILRATKEVLSNVTHDGERVPVTFTYGDSDKYIFVYIPSTDEDSTDDTYIFDVVLRVEVVTEFVTDMERETPSNEIADQVTRLVTDVDFFNAALDDFEVILVNPVSSDRDTQQNNTSSLITKRKDFNLKVQQL